MFKSFVSFIVSLFFPHEQLVMVVADDLNSTMAMMQRYEKRDRWMKTGSAIEVTLGRNGLGYEGLRDPYKREGDGKSPIGLFPITATFGYDPHPNSQMPYWYADENLICVDDVQDPRYNQIVSLDGETPGSFERMRREDGLYRNGAVVGYNAMNEQGRGSCIFLHIRRPDGRATSGCTAMEENELIEVLKWLDPDKKPLLLQIPKSECEQYQREFSGIECN